MRKQQATRLVARVRGVVELTEKLPPRDVQVVVTDYLSALVAGVELFEGRLEAFADDELTALFGVAAEQKDHPLRALVCATELRRRHEAWRRERIAEELPAPELSLGVATGPFLCGEIGPADRARYAALGPTALLAARLGSGAKAGQLLITPDVHRAAARRIDGWEGPVAVPRMRFESLGPRKLAGVHGNRQVINVVVMTR